MGNILRINSEFGPTTIPLQKKYEEPQNKTKEGPKFITLEKRNKKN